MNHSNDPLVSIVIPTYNRANQITRALDSIVAQTYRNYEVIIVDNNSTDNTDEVLAGYSDLNVILIKINNEGIIAASRNKGVKAASGELIAFLDSDDWWLPKKLHHSVQEVRRGADFVYHDLYLASDSSESRAKKRIRAHTLRAPVQRSLLRNGNAIITSTVVVKKSLLEEVNYQSEDPDLIAWEDYDCWVKIAKHTDAFSRIREPLGFYWIGGGSISSPANTIHVLELIKQRYFRSDDVLPQWYYYAMGRALYHQKDYSSAMPMLYKTISIKGLTNSLKAIQKILFIQRFRLSQGRPGNEQ